MKNINRHGVLAIVALLVSQAMVLSPLSIYGDWQPPTKSYDELKKESNDHLIRLGRTALDDYKNEKAGSREALVRLSNTVAEMIATNAAEGHSVSDGMVGISEELTTQVGKLLGPRGSRGSMIDALLFLFPSDRTAKDIKDTLEWKALDEETADAAEVLNAYMDGKDPRKLGLQKEQLLKAVKTAEDYRSITAGEMASSRKKQKRRIKGKIRQGVIKLLEEQMEVWKKAENIAWTHLRKLRWSLEESLKKTQGASKLL